MYTNFSKLIVVTVFLKIFNLNVFDFGNENNYRNVSEMKKSDTKPFVERKC